jgi:hypothetical protein
MYAVADRAAEGVTAYVLAFKAAARKQRQSEYVEKYQQRMYANKLKHLPTNASTCSPCPTAQPNGQPLTVANKATGEALARQAATAAGFRGRALEEAVAVARAESTFNPSAANPTSSARGMWQIMLTAHAGDPDIAELGRPVRLRADGVADLQGRHGLVAVVGVAGRPRPGRCGAAGGRGLLHVHPGPLDVQDGRRRGVGGGYGNGQVPLTALAHPAQAPTAWFRPDAAAAFDRLSAAYAARFGHPLRVTDSYRDYAHQVSTKAAKGYLAAKPGRTTGAALSHPRTTVAQTTGGAGARRWHWEFAASAWVRVKRTTSGSSAQRTRVRVTETTPGGLPSADDRATGQTERLGESYGPVMRLSCRVSRHPRKRHP